MRSARLKLLEITVDPSVIRANGITFSYPGADRAALENVSVTIRRGEVLAIVGANGSGKSTLAKLLAGLDTPTRAWLKQENPEGDSVDFTDRVFLVQNHGRIFPPRRPTVAAGLPDDERAGVWHALRADFPDDAFVHVRGTEDPSAGHACDPGDCRACS